MSPAELTARTFRSLRWLFGAMFVGQAVFLITSVALVRLGEAPRLEGVSEIIQYAVPVMVTLVVALGAWLASRRYARARKRRMLSLQLQGYQLGLVVHLAMLNGAAAFLLVVYLLTHQWVYLVLYGVVGLLYLRQRPTPAHARAWLGLTESELPNG